MKRITKELNVDFIGEQEPLTQAEAAAISQYFSNKKQSKSKKLLLPRPKPLSIQEANS